MFFKNVTVFEYSDDGVAVSPTDLEFAAASLRARPPEKHETQTVGFVPALWRGALEMIHLSDRFAMAAVRIEQKRVPPSLWREDTANRCREFAGREGRDPNREECATLKAASYTDLLSRAFPRAREVRVLFAPGLVAVGTASKADVDEVTALLRSALGSLPLRRVCSVETTRTMLTHWVKNGAPHDRETNLGFHLGEAATLRARLMRGEGAAAVVTLRNAHLQDSEVRQHIENQKHVERLAFAWKLSGDISLTGVVDSEFMIRSLRTDGAIADTGDAEDAATIYAAEFFAEAALLERLIRALRDKLCPSVAKRQAGVDFRADGERSVRIAADLYKARDSARRMCGDKYRQNMADLAEHLQVMAAPGESVLATATRLAKERTGAEAWFVLAAAVEMLEPTVEG